MEKYLPYIAEEVWAATKTKQLRVVPVDKAVGTASKAIPTYDQIRKISEDKKLIAVATCVCAKRKGLLDQPCKFPTERCIQFDALAQYYIDNEIAREIDMVELLDIVQMGEEKGLVISPVNAEQIPGFCLCCSCCCMFLQGLRAAPFPAAEMYSTFQAEIYSANCIKCGTCEESCPIGAVGSDDESFFISKDRCIGCGHCIAVCPENAIVLTDRPKLLKQASLPKDMADMYKMIADERGV